MNSASYEYKNMSARRGAQFVPIGIPTICWKTFSRRRRKFCRLETLDVLLLLVPYLSQIFDVLFSFNFYGLFMYLSVKCTFLCNFNVKKDTERLLMLLRCPVYSPTGQPI